MPVGLRVSVRDKATVPEAHLTSPYSPQIPAGSPGWLLPGAMRGQEAYGMPHLPPRRKRETFHHLFNLLPPARIPFPQRPTRLWLLLCPWLVEGFGGRMRRRREAQKTALSVAHSAAGKATLRRQVLPAWVSERWRLPTHAKRVQGRRWTWTGRTGDRQ